MIQFYFPASQLNSVWISEIPNFRVGQCVSDVKERKLITSLSQTVT